MEQDNSKKFTKKRISQLTQASDVLQRLLGNGKSPLSDQFLRWQLWRKWPEIVGESIASQTHPVGYDRGVLVIYVKNSAWMQELSFLSQTFRIKINDHIGREWVSAIRFSLDARDIPKPGEGDPAWQSYLESKQEKK